MRKLLLWALLWSWTAMGQGQMSGFYVFYKKPDTWSQVYLYTWFVQNNQIVEPTGRWPGKALADVAGWYRGFIDQSQTDPLDDSINLIFSNGSGQQTADLKRKTNGWYKNNQWFDLNPDEKLFTVAVQSGSGGGRYSPGTLVRVQAQTPAPSLFQGWAGDVALLADPLRADGQFSMPERNVTLTATYEDLTSGQTQFQTLCVKCHGKSGEGGVGPALQISAGKCTSCSQTSVLEDRISRTMPLGKAGTCTGSCARDIARYIRFALNTESAVDCSDPANQRGRRQMRLLTEREYRNTVRDVLGITAIDALKFWPEAANVLGYDNNADASIVSDRHLIVFAKAAHEIAGKVNLGNFALADMGLRLYRRPLSADEVSSFAGLKPAAAIEVMLQSPYFLYRSELGDFVSPLNAFALNSYEVATALSYTLTGTAPDSQLLAAAADGTLKDAAKRRSEAERLLSTDAARDTFGDFAVQWLGIQSLPYVTRDNPKLTSGIRRDMLDETRRFLAQLVFDQRASVKDIYLAEATPVSRQLAAYYGLPQPSVDGQLVNYDSERQGLLAQGSLHATLANSREASPIKRGVFVRNRLLCQDLPPPPANVDTTIPPPVPGLTMRERLARHLSQGQQSDGSNSCYSCHQYIDKVGFGFERFDEVGLFRSAYAEKPGVAIDVSGEIKSPIALADSNVQSFQNFTELSHLLSENARAKACLGIQYLRYAEAHVEQSQDQCQQKAITGFLQQDQSVRDMLIEFVSADSFVWRK